MFKSMTTKFHGLDVVDCKMRRLRSLQQWRRFQKTMQEYVGRPQGPETILRITLLAEYDEQAVDYSLPFRITRMGISDGSTMQDRQRHLLSRKAAKIMQEELWLLRHTPFYFTDILSYFQKKGTCRQAGCFGPIRVSEKLPVNVSTYIVYV